MKWSMDSNIHFCIFPIDFLFLIRLVPFEQNDQFILYKFLAGELEFLE